jgi:hypothetical protein
MEAEALGMPFLPFIILPHPMGNQVPDKVHAAIDPVMEEVGLAMTSSVDELEQKYRGKYSETKKTFKSKSLFSQEMGRIEVADSLDAIYRLMDLRGWWDGLPVVPPTEARVSRMLEYSDRGPQEVIGIVPPRRGKATMEKLAINAVMAGCLPEYFPFVIAAVQAMVEPAFNLYGIQATTNPVAPLLIANGPLVKEIDLNYGYNVFGQGWRANAAIGRTIRFVLTNIGGGIPGTFDRATQGQPGKYSFCIAENEEENPWEPLHVERGFKAEASTVTMIGGVGTLNIMDAASSTAQSTLLTLANGMASVGTNNVSSGGEPLLVMCPEHAHRVAQGGFTKKEVKTFLYENSRIPITRFSREVVSNVIQKRRPKWYLDAGPEARVAIADNPEAIMVVVAGGAGAHSVFVPTFGSSTKAVTKPVALRDGRTPGSIKEFRKG